MRKSILLVIFILATLGGFCQEWKWANRFSQNPNPDNTNLEFSISAIKLSSLGNIFVGGYYISNITYGDSTFYGHPDLNSTKPDIFLFKLDGLGNLLWGKTFGTEENDLLDNLIIDSNENIYASFRTQSTNLDLGNNVKISTTGKYDAAIVKFNTEGECTWGINILKGISKNEKIYGLVFSENNSKLYFAGTAMSPTFLIGNSEYNNADNGGDLCVGSINTNDGSINWSKQFPTNNTTSKLNEISIDKDGHIYAVGTFLETLTIEGKDYISKGSGDLLLLKLNANNGNPIWVATGGSTADDLYWSVNAKEEYVYSLGYIQGITTVDSIATTNPKIQSSTIGSAGALKMFISKYNMEGRLLWKKSLDGGGLGYSLNVNLLDNILVATGYFSGSMNFNLNSISSNGGSDAAYFVFDTKGNPISAKAIKGTGNYLDKGQAVYLDEDFNVIVGGLYNSSQVEFINGETTFKTLTNDYAGYPEGFIAKCTNDYVTTFTNKKNITCYGGNDGELTITPYFGHSPFTYSWKKDGIPLSASDSALTDLTPGVYEVTVVDGENNSITNSYTLTQPNNINVTLSATDNACYGDNAGSIEVTSTTGGNGNYSYFWSTGDGYISNATLKDQTGLIAGTYNLTVTDVEGCVYTTSQVINQGNEMLITGSVSNITNSGNNGAVDIRVIGGSGTYTYNWTYANTSVSSNQDLTDLSDAGNYTITVTDENTCNSQATFVVPSENILFGFKKSKTDVKCKGESTGAIELNYVGTNNPVSVSWKKNSETYNATGLSITGLVAGTYEATLSAEGETNSVVTVVIEEPSDVVSGTITPTNATCNGNSNGSLLLIPTGGAAPYTYVWTSDLLNNPVTTQNVNRIKAGNYSVVITDANGCSTQAISSTVGQPDAIDFEFIEVSPTCYNSTNGSMEVKNITGGDGNYTYLWSNTLTSTKINNLKSGYYRLTVTDGNRCYKQKSERLEQPTVVRISTSGRSNASCPDKTDGNIRLSSSGGVAPYTWVWTDGENNVIGDNSSIYNLGVGTYTASLTDANLCSATASYSLTSSNSNPSPILTCTDTTSCAGSEITFNGTGLQSTRFEFLVNDVVAQNLSTTREFSTSELNNNDVVSMRVQSDAGCEATSSTITVTRNSLPSISIDATSNTICNGSSTRLTASGANTYSWNNGIVNGEDFTPIATTTYTVTGTDINGCTSTAQETVVVNEIPTATISTNSSTIWCSGDNISVLMTSRTADSYQWIKDGVDVTDSTNNTFTANQPGNYKVKISVNGCVAESNVIQVVENANPIVSVESNSVSICQGEELTLTASGDATSYTWSDDIINGTAFVPAETHTYTVTGTNANNCSSTQDVLVTVNPLPTGSISTTDPTSWCGDNNINFTLAVDNTTASLQWLLNGNPIQDATQTQYYGTETGSYSVSMTSNGCSALSDTITVGTYARPTVSAMASSTEICAGDSVVIYGEGAETYTWNNGVTDSVAFAPIASTTYTVIGTDFNGCTDTAQVSIAVNSYPVGSISTSDQITWCEGSNINFTLAVDNTTASLQWLLNGNPIQDATQTQYNGTETGSYSVSMTSNGCSALSDTITVGTYARPTISAMASSTDICAGDSVVIYGEGAETYMWDNGITDSVAFVPLTSATYSVIGTDFNGCTDTAQVSIAVNSYPVGSISTSDQITWCEGSDINFTLAVDNTTASLQWLLNGIPIEGATQTQYNGTETGNYSVSMTSNGCSALSDTITVGTYTRPTVSAMASSTDICAGDSVVIYGEGADTYSWDNGVTDSVAFVPLNSSTYTVIGTDINGCTDTAQVSIAVNSYPVGSISTSDQITWCEGSDINFTLAVDNTTASLQWLLNGTPIQDATQTQYNGNETGSYSVSMTSNGCSALSDTITVGTYARPTVSAMASSTEICAGDSVVLYGEGTETYMWDNGVTDSVAFAPLTSSTYTVIGTDINGCTDTAQISIAVNSYPVGSISTSDQIMWCEGSDINFTLAVDNTTASLQWLLNGNPIQDATQTQYNGTETGSYSVSMTSNGCSALSDTITVGTYARPTVSAMASSTEICAGDSVVIYGEGADTYSWDNGVTDSVAFVPLTSATYTVIGTDINGCTDTAQIEISIKELASTAISATQTIWCSNDTIEFTLSVDTTDQYQWYFNNELIVGATEQTYTDSVEGTYKAMLIKNGCTTYSDTIAITINTAPNVGIIASDTTVFEGDSVILSGTGADTYQWDNNVTDGVAFTVDSTLTYTVIGIDINGCSNTAEIEITAVPSIIVTIASTDTLLWCQGDSIGVFMSIDTIADSYQWLRNGINIENATDSVYTAEEAGDYNVQLFINNRFYYSNIITVTAFGLPEISIEASDTTICAGDSITLTAIGALNYTWSNDIENGTAFVPAISSEFTVIGTDINGCSSTSNIYINVNSTTTKINTTDPTIWCTGSSINVALWVEESESYQWSFNNVPIDSATTQNLTANAAGIYGIVTTNGICSATDTIVIYEVETPEIGIVTDDTTEWCEGNASAVTMVATLPDAVSYQWMKNGENIAAATGTIYTTNEAGNYTLYATFGGNNCSATSDTLTITEYPLPEVDLPNDSIIINITGNYTLDAGDGINYLWSISDSTIELENNTSQTFVVDGSTLGAGIFTFYVSVTSEHGCVASDSAVVKIYLGNEIITQSDWKTNIYPNPTSNSFMLNVDGINGNECFVKVFNSTGMMVQNRIIAVDDKTINEHFDFSNHAKGVYHIVIQSNGQVKTCKLVLK